MIVLALVLASGWRFNTFYIFYSSWFVISLLVIVLRASWDSITALVLDMVKFERRALLVGSPDMTTPIAESITRATTDRHGVAYRVVGTHSLVAGVGTEDEPPAARDLDRMLDPGHIDEVILAGTAGRDQSILDLLDAQNASILAEEGASNSVFDFLVDLMEVDVRLRKLEEEEKSRKSNEFLHGLRRAARCAIP